MAIVFTDLEALIVIAIVLIIVYIIGTYWKHRTLTFYAHWFEENLSKRGHVKFASHGHAGLKVKYEDKDRAGKSREMHFALSLGARENLIYYPYSIFSQDHDKLAGWVLLHRPIQSNVRIMKRKNKRRIQESQNTPRLSEVQLKELEKTGYVMYATDHEYARQLASEGSIPAELKKRDIVEFIEFDRISSKLHLVGKLSKETLPELVNFMFVLGKVA